MNVNKKSICIHSIIYALVFCAGAGTGYYLHFRQSRTSNTRFERLQRAVKEQQSESAELINSLESEIRDLKSNNTEAKRIVDSMGIQLDSDTATIRRATELIKTLKSQIMDLQNLYSGGNSSDRNSDL